MESILVPQRNRLEVRCTLFKAQEPTGKELVLIHHGICHTLEQYRPLIEQLNKLHINAVMVEQRSDRAWFKNCIGLSQYRENLAAVVRQLNNDGQNVYAYVLHSMGAEIGEEMQQEHKELQLPTVFLAPVPLDGCGA
jgi:alpha-beta hydrolase superfamily lysophospholipase